MATLNSSTPRTWLSSETVTAAQFNEELSSNFNAAVVQPGFVYLTDTNSSVMTVGLPAILGSTHHKHVRIVGVAANESGAAASLFMRFSGITSTSYAYSFLDSSGSNSTGGQGVSTTQALVGLAAGGFSTISFAPFDITITNPQSTNWKSWIFEASLVNSTAAGGMRTLMGGGVLQSTISTVTSITLIAGVAGAKFSSGSRVSAYWIA